MTTHKQESTPEQRLHVGVELDANPQQTPHLIDGCNTLPKLLNHRCDQHHARVAMRYKDLGIWHAHSWSDYYQNAERIAQALASMGLQRGDVISVLSENNPEWLFIDMAAQCMGIVVTGVYTTDSSKQLAYLVEDSGTEVLFVENDEQLDKYLSAQEQMPSLKKVVVLDPYGLHAFKDPKVIFANSAWSTRGYRYSGVHLGHHGATQGCENLPGEPDSYCE